MPTVIDSLIVTLGLDSKDVDTKAPGVRSKLSDLEKSSKETEKGFTGLTGAVESFGAVLGGIVSASIVSSFVKDIVATNTHLYYLSQNLGMSAQKLSAWGQMAKQLGGSSASIQGFFGQVRGMYGQYLMGQTPPLQKLFAMVGINPMLAASKGGEWTTMQLAEKFKNDDKGPNRWKAASFLEAGGLSEDVVNMILQGPAWVKSHLNQLTPLSPTDRQVKASADLTQKTVLMETALNKVGQNLVSKLEPLLDKVVTQLSKIAAWMTNHTTATEAIAGVGAGGLALVGLLGAFKILAPLATGLGAALGSITLPLTLAVAGIAALSVAIYELHKHGDFKKAANAVEKTAKSVGKWTEDTSRSIGNWVTSTAKSDFDLVKDIAKKEGFFAKGSGSGNIPQRANNPADIEYGAFARSHGATGFIMAKGGHKIATFPDVATGYAAAQALLETKGYAGLSPAQKIARWQTGSSILKGVPNASHVSSSVASSSSTTSSTSNDNSKSVHIGTMNVNQPQGSSTSNPSHGMDWLFAPQFNGGLM